MDTNKMLELHNEQRLERGLKPLVLDDKLCLYAAQHSKFMASKNKMVHSKMSDLASAAGAGSVAENIAWGQEDEKEVVSAWMHSPGHKRNILGSEYNKVGFGMTLDKNGRPYWCAVFCKENKDG